jgi:hypothetical protein
LIIERTDEAEYRIRNVDGVVEKEPMFHDEDFPTRLSARDAAGVIEALENPPAPNRAARRAAKRFRKDYN